MIKRKVIKEDSKDIVFREAEFFVAFQKFYFLSCFFWSKLNSTGEKGGRLAISKNVYILGGVGEIRRRPVAPYIVSWKEMLLSSF